MTKNHDKMILMEMIYTNIWGKQLVQKQNGGSKTVFTKYK